MGQKSLALNKGYPDNNPKTQFGVQKVPLNTVPPVAILYLAQALGDGAVKYGPYNWREYPISSSVYYGAMLRHIFAWWDGEENAEDSGVHHLGHAMACMALLLDAQSLGVLNDDRPVQGATGRLLEEFKKSDV